MQLEKLIVVILNAIMSKNGLLLRWDLLKPEFTLFDSLLIPFLSLPRWVLLCQLLRQVWQSPLAIG
jgi:hypothetical protein